VVMTRTDAVKRCRDVGVKDFYFDSCVFDLISTGDLNFTLAAYHAYADTLRLYPEVANSLDNRSSLEEIDKEYADKNHATSARNSKLSHIHRTTFVLMVYFIVSSLARGCLL